MTEATEIRLSVRDLTVHFQRPGGDIRVVRGVSFDIRAGETLALVGESGSGKSVTSFAVMRLLEAAPRCRIGGQILVGETDILPLSERQMTGIRGARIAMIFQEPLTALNPVHRIGDQIAEAIRFHRKLSRRDLEARVLELLTLVGIPEPRTRMRAYPNELSGGMRQRVAIAIALALEPDVLIADEPTTALDVTIQAQILDLLREIQQRTRMAILFITHDFGVVSEIADRVMVMYAGRIVEEGTLSEVIETPRMPYTAGLLASVPRLEDAGRATGPLGSIEGFVPTPDAMPRGCSFHPRCGFARDGLCTTEVPELTPVAGTAHRVRCARLGDAELRTMMKESA